MAGVQNMVAPQGTAFTPEHARVLKRYVNEVVLCFDSDEAGQNAAVRVLDSLLASELAVRVAVMPAPHDPDSYIKQVGADAFAALLREAPGFFDFFLERLCRQNDLGTDKGRLAVVRQLGEALNKTGSPVLLDTYAQKASQRLNVSAEAVRHELKRLSRPSRVRAAPSADPAAEMAPEEAPQQPPSTQEMWLLKVLFLAEDHVPWIAEHLEMAWLKHPLAKAIVAARLEASRENTWQGVAAFLDHFEDPVARSLITAAASESRKLPDLEKVLKGDPFKKGLLELLRNEHIERQSALVQQQLTRPGLSDEASAALLQEKTRLRAEKQRRLGGNPPESTSL
jgi:DNA primase